MVAIKITQPDPVGFSRCGERARLLEKGQTLVRKMSKADASIADKVDRIIWNNSVLRNTDYWQIDVAVKDGVVFLSGNVTSTTVQKIVEAAAQTIPGVLEVVNEMTPDDRIAGDLAGVLGEIEHIYRDKFFTGVNNGVIVLTGVVDSASVRSLAEKAAASIAGVRGVINSVRAPGIGADAEDQRFFQPFVGELIYFRDNLGVKVHKVIINPDNRRVAAMVICGRLSTSKKNFGFLNYEEGQVGERLIAIPMSDVHNLSNGFGFLKIDSTQAAGYSDFDPASFTSPGEGWIPPYPYCVEDVLFLVESVDRMNRSEDVLTLIPVASPRPMKNANWL